MTAAEAYEIDNVVNRLRGRYPELDDDTIRAAAVAAFGRLEGARLRQFTMLLAEKSASDACREMRASPSTAADRLRSAS